MFPTYDPEVIKSVLYKTKGHMERTIELLLLLEQEQQMAFSTAPTVVTNENQIAHNLASDFLRYDDDYHHVAAPTQQQPASTTNMSQIMQDHILAEQLQRQLMMEEALGTCVKFLIIFKAAPSQQAPRTNRPATATNNTPNTTRPQQQYQTASGGIGSKPVAQQDTSIEGQIAQKLSNLSDIAKKKLAEFRARFGTNNNSQASATTHNPNAPKRPVGVANGGPEYSSLLNQEDDDDAETPEDKEWNKKL